MGNKHKHYDLIVAKAENMDLVLFVKAITGWVELAKPSLPSDNESEYFLCLPQHKEACLHWLNGGDVLVKHADEEERLFNGRVSTVVRNASKGDRHWFAESRVSFRIKPRKEKRWIAIRGGGLTSNALFKSENEARCVCGTAEQFIEIEVEV